jgi:hypothetical protein
MANIWNAADWYAAVADRIPRLFDLSVGPMRNNPGVHPVRSFESSAKCEQLIANLSHALVPSQFGPIVIAPEGEGALLVDRSDNGGAPTEARKLRGASFELSSALRPAHRIERWNGFPYLANSAWLVRVETVGEFLLQEDGFFNWPHPFDEVALNVVIRRDKTSGAAASKASASEPGTAPTGSLCIARGGFALHPSYAHDRDLEQRLHIAASAALHERLATHKRRAALVSPPPARNARVGPRNERAESLNCEPIVTAAPDLPDAGEGAGDDADAGAMEQADPRHGAEIHIFVHAALLPRWPEVLGSLLGAMKSSGLAALASSVTVATLGDHSQLDRPGKHGFAGCCAFEEPELARKLQVVRVHSGLAAYETPTLRLLHARARSLVRASFAADVASNNESDKDAKLRLQDRREPLLLYLHTKGVGGDAQLSGKEDWREFMAHFLIERHCLCIRRLAARGGDGAHIGASRPSPLAATCGVDLRFTPLPHYAGNFWWARADYVARLRSPEDADDLVTHPNALNSVRHNQEFWLLTDAQVTDDSDRSSSTDAMGCFAVAARAAVDLWRWEADSRSRSRGLEEDARFLRSDYANESAACECARADRPGSWLGTNHSQVRKQTKPHVSEAKYAISFPYFSALVGLALTTRLSDVLADYDLLENTVAAAGSHPIDDAQLDNGNAAELGDLGEVFFDWKRELSDDPNAERVDIANAARSACQRARTEYGRTLPPELLDACSDRITSYALSTLRQLCRFKLRDSCIDDFDASGAWTEVWEMTNAADGAPNDFRDTAGDAAVWEHYVESPSDLSTIIQTEGNAGCVL